MRELTNILQNGQDWFDESNNVKLRKFGKDFYLSFFQVGVSASVRANYARNNEYYFDLFAKVPRTVGSRTGGFLGTPDGNRRNDLYARGEKNNPLPLHYRDRALYPHMLTCKK